MSFYDQNRPFGTPMAPPATPQNGDLSWEEAAYFKRINGDGFHPPPHMRGMSLAELEARAREESRGAREAEEARQSAARIEAAPKSIERALLDPPSPKRAMSAQRGWRQRVRFLNQFKRCGSYREAATRIGVDESTVRRWRAKFPAFRARCDAILAERFQEKSDDLKLRAGQPRTRPYFFKGKQGKRTIVVFDEASAIPDVIWDTTEGALTDKETELLWLVFGNPTRNTGRFRECFARFAHRWRGRQVDSRTVGLTNKAQLQRWVDDHGEDSDFVRVRVRGIFPRAGSMQFIDGETVDEALRREFADDADEPLVIGVDVARFGDDRSVIYPRRGRDARSRPPLVLRGVDTMTLSGKVTEVAAQYRADAIFVDEGGVGGGVVDRLRQLGVPHVIGVNFAGRPDGWAPEGTGPLYANKRAEIWGRMKDWLKAGAIVDDPTLTQDLIGVEYGYDARNAIQLERKDDMKKRGLASPDLGDALALTFAQPVHPQGRRTEADLQPRILDQDHEYDFFHDI